ncbi:MAG: DUF805 domain-containing protein [Sphingomonas bacterium]|nr:DUF805 domain-containing protein [Sphingomonas bacterium]
MEPPTNPARFRWLLIVLVPIVGVIVLIVFFVTQGTQGPNKYGDDPYAGGASRAM